MNVMHCDNCGKEIKPKDPIFMMSISPTSTEMGLAIGGPVHQLNQMCKPCVVLIQTLKIK